MSVPEKFTRHAKYLDPGKIDLWIILLGKMNDAERFEFFRSLMSNDEKISELSFLYPLDRQRYVMTRAGLRLVLSIYSARSPKDWNFGRSHYGRPFIADPADDEAGLDFNVSHSRKAVLIAVARKCVIGVDIEENDDPVCYQDIAKLCLSSSELHDLERLPAGVRIKRFFDYWTLKEAFIKADGRGHAIPIELVTFAFPPQGGLDFISGVSAGDCVSNWWFWKGSLKDEHIVAISLRRVPGIRPTVSVTQMLPSLEEWSMVPSGVMTTS